MSADVAVVGGGAAGMMAALCAAQSGARVILLERNEKLGKKLYITGKGRCNLTNVADGDAFLQNVPTNAPFLRSALHALPPSALMETVEAQGVALKVERGGRVFPASDKSSDILRAFEKALAQTGVDVRLGTGVRKPILDTGRVTGLELMGGARVACGALVLATGGLSYPTTGSTGDGHGWCTGMGHTMVQTRPGLVPLVTREQWPAQLQGVTLKNVVLEGWAQGKRFFAEQGELLFTHFGLSGPLALTLSSHLPQNLEGIGLRIDTKPALDVPTLDRRLTRDFLPMQRKQLSGAFDALLPRAMARVFVGLTGLDGEVPVGQVTRAQRRGMAELLKGIPLTLEGLRPIEEAIITRGGVDVREIEPGTMRSKKTHGLFIAGELLDVDALTGGYNLHIAFATGRAAGIAAARCAAGL